jgi:hypothetical protein
MEITRVKKIKKKPSKRKTAKRKISGKSRSGATGGSSSATSSKQKKFSGIKNGKSTVKGRKSDKEVRVCVFVSRAGQAWWMPGLEFETAAVCCRPYHSPRGLHILYT